MKAGCAIEVCETNNKCAKDINEASFQAVCRTKLFTGKRRRILKDAMLNGNECSSNKAIIKKLHSLDVQTIQLLFGQLLLCSSLAFQLVPSDVDRSVTCSVRVQAKM